MMTTITTVLDAKRSIYIETPVITKTYGEVQYKALVKEVCTTYAQQATKIFCSLFSPEVVDETCVAINKEFSKTLLNAFNNSTYASRETEEELYNALSAVSRHIDDLATDRNFYLYSKNQH